MSSSMREQRLTENNDDIKDITQQLQIKEKRRVQSESVKNYKLCDDIMSEISTLKVTLREKKYEAKVLLRKTSQAAWYERRKTSRSGASESDADTIILSDTGSSALSSPMTQRMDAQSPSPLFTTPPSARSSLTSEPAYSPLSEQSLLPASGHSTSDHSTSVLSPSSPPSLEDSQPLSPSGQYFQ